jgi:NAD(P)-dependent dehydrogenase (short-subunit alcohol dehydrogenase family)/acyl carrier protein
MLMSDHAPNGPTDPATRTSALGITQQSLLAFQRMQEQTASLHKQFLDNQQAALATLQALVAQQQALLTGQPTSAVALVPVRPAPVAAPVPVAPPPAVVPLPAVKATQVVSPPAPAPVAKAPAPKPPAPARDTSGILLSVVAEKTGYPADMLGLDMALDADLGIDSIKRVEILSALQERIPDAPAVKPEHLGTLHTLRDIVNFLGAPAAELTVTPPPVANAAIPAPSANGSDVAGTLLSVVAEKTGYPADMLGLDMALDADLGIDSIKRVEILSALQERIPDAPAVKPEHLGTLHTLRDIASFLASAAPPPTVSPPVSPAPEAPRPFGSALTPGSAKSERISEAMDHAEPPATFSPEVPASAGPTTKVIRSVIRPTPIGLDIPRQRIRLDKHALVWVIGDPSSLTARLIQEFDTAGCRPQSFSWSESPLGHDPTCLAGLVLVAPDERGPDDLPLRAFRWLKRAAPALAASAKAGGAFFTTVTMLDGAFGFGPLDPSRDPVRGALAGLAKTAAKEWTGVACKAIDIDPNIVSHAPDILVEEILTVGPSEVGLSAKGRVFLELVESPAASRAGDVGALAAGDVVVATGGGRGVTAEALFPLVRAIRPRLILLGRTPVADAEPDWLANLTDETQIKQAIIARLDKPATPKLVGEECKRVLACREVRRNLRRFREAGAAVEYIPVDVQDTAALALTLADVRRRLGPIAALVHGAGVLADRRIEDLTDEQFQYVYSTKVTGLRNLLAATEKDPIKAIVLFSSSTGRFGRTGQIAYAAANEVLNKTAQRLKRTRPDCRTVAINWGPWQGGMVTPALAKVFEQEGIGLIPYAEGGETLFRELASSDGPAEVVVLARPVAAMESPRPVLPAPGGLVQVFERTVTLTDHPVLRSHVIGSKAVLPFVLHVEWMAHAAMHGNPGLKIHGFDDLRIFQGVQLEEATPALIQVLSGKAARRDGLFVVPVEIRGLRKGKEVTHSRGDIVLADRLPDAPVTGGPPDTGPFSYSPDEVYDEILFHGPDLRAVDRVDGMSGAGLVAFVRTAPPPRSWMDAPLRSAWLADPLAVDAAFQLLSVWSYQKHRAVSLPCFAGRYRQYRRQFPAEGVLVTARITHDTGATARADVEFVDADGRLVARMTDVEHVIDPSLNEAFRRGRLAAPTESARLSRIGS